MPRKNPAVSSGMLIVGPEPYKCIRAFSVYRNKFANIAEIPRHQFGSMRTVL
jgi:hypothetical protein